MASPSGAYISISQIVNSYLFAKGKDEHSFVKVTGLVASAVQELGFLGVMTVNQVLLNRDASQQWFTLPDDYCDWVSVGVRCGDKIFPLRVDQRLMKSPAFDNTGGFSGVDIGEGLDTDGNWTNWVNCAYTPSTFSSTTGVYGPCCTFQGSYIDGWNSLIDPWYWNDIVNINPDKGIIMVPQNFTSTEMVLTYVPSYSVDKMLKIPLLAQGVIEAYVAWRWELNRRRPLVGQLQTARQEYENQLRVLARRMSTLTAADIKHIRDDAWAKRAMHLVLPHGFGIGMGGASTTGVTSGGTGGGTGGTGGVTTVVGLQALPTYVVPSDTGSVTFPALIGKTTLIVFRNEGRLRKTRDYTFNNVNGTITFTGIGGLYADDYIDINYM